VIDDTAGELPAPRTRPEDAGSGDEPEPASAKARRDELGTAFARQKIQRPTQPVRDARHRVSPGYILLYMTTAKRAGGPRRKHTLFRRGPCGQRAPLGLGSLGACSWPQLHCDIRWRVERSLYERANGYNYEAVKIFMLAGAKQPVVVHYVERMPPDVTAGIFWLKNRDPEHWRDFATARARARKISDLR